MPIPSVRFFFFFSSRRRHTRSLRDWSSDVCSSDLRGLSGKSDLTGIGYAEGIWIGRYRRDILERAFRSESDELRVEAIAHNGEQPPVLGPAVVKDWPVNARTGEVLHAFVAVMGEHEVVRCRAVFRSEERRVGKECRSRWSPY